MSLDSDEDDFAEYGNPVEQFDEETLPRKKAISVHDQIATDKYGRRRFHGAFTGGFSAGFLNSVGSLEGWTPTSFKSSRADKAETKEQKPEDFMDEEDMDEFGIAPKVLHATDDFNNSSLKRKKSHHLSDGPIPGDPVLSELLQAARETVGIKLLMKMGWKPGQGVGPRVTKAEKKRMKKEYGKVEKKIYGCSLPQEMNKTKQSDSDDNSTDYENYENVTFAPEDFQPVLCKPKDNFFGLGFSGLDRRPILSTHIDLFEPTPLKMVEKKKKVLIAGQAFGVGAFEEEDEDIYSREDMSQYDFSLESASTTSKQKSQNLLKSLPNYNGDILEGFILGKNSETFKKYFPPPPLPEGFQPKHQPRKSRFEPSNIKMESNDSRRKGLQRHDMTAVEREIILGDKILKSASDNVNESSKVEMNEKSDGISKVTDKLMMSTKVGYSNFKPFAADPEKEKRYERYLELLEKGQKEKLSYYQPLAMTEWEREHESIEFEKAAILYKPLSGMMSDRFVSASHPEDMSTPLPSDSKLDEEKDKRAAVEMKMFGRLTREETDWRPCSLLCKRFNVPELFPGSGDSSNSKSKSSKFSVFSFLDAASFNKTLNFENEKQFDRPVQEIPPDSETRDVIPSTSEEVIKNKIEELPVLKSEDSSSDAFSIEQKTIDAQLEFPDPPAKIDLFKAIFLSSSESESDSDEEEKKVKEVPQVAKETNVENKNSSETNSIVLSDEDFSFPKNTQRNLSPPRGVFANLDLDAINIRRKDTVESNKEKHKDDGNQVVCEDTLDHPSDEQQIQNSDIKDIYGPDLPALNLVTSKISASSPSSEIVSRTVVSRNCEWVEKSNKGIHQDKHKKHKKSSKHKKHKKSKHKKKRH